MSLLQNVRSSIFQGSFECVIDVSDSVDKLAHIESISNNKSPSSLNIIILNLFDRIYGEDATTFVPPSNWDEKYGHWLLGTSGDAEDNKASALIDFYLSCRGARLVELMAPESTLFKSLLKMNWHYHMNIRMLSEKAQMKLSGSKEYTFVASAHHLLYDNLLKMQQQQKLIRSEAGDMLLRVDVFTYHLVCLLRYGVYQKDFSATYSTGPVRRQGSVVASISNSAKAMITTPASSPRDFYCADVYMWKSGNVYLALVERYIQYFLSSPLHGLRGAARETASALSSETELFLWLAIDLWVDISMVVNRNFSNITSIYSSTKDSSYYHNHHTHQNAFGPKSCAEVIFLDSNSPLPSCASMQCAYLLLANLQSLSIGSSDAPYLSLPLLVTNVSNGRSSRTGGKGDGSVCKMFLLPRGLEILQQPLFDMLRALFTKFDTISSSQQLMAMALWLRWTQPWRFYDAHGDIFGDDGAIYSAEWRPYVAANLHFYTSLLVIFLRSSIYLNSFSWSSSRSSTSSFGGGSSSSYGSTHERDIQGICMKLFSNIIKAYAYPGGNGVSLFDDVGSLYASIVATGGDSGNVGLNMTSSAARSATPSKPTRKISSKKSASKGEMSVAWTDGSQMGSRGYNVSPGTHGRRKTSPHRLADQDFSDVESDPDESRSMSRLLDPPSSFSQRQTPGSTIYSTRSPYGDFPSSGTILQTPKTTRTVRTDASLTGSVSRRRHSTSYTPLETVSSNVMGATNSWSGVSAPQLRRGSSSTDRRRGLSGDHISTPIIARGQSAEPVSAAEIMTVYHQHSTLYPDECIPSSWACGSSLKEAADVTNKLESLLSQAKKNPSIANYVANVTDALRLMPGLFSSDAFHENERTSCGSNADALSTEVLVNSSSPDRYLGSDLHGQLTPKGREELLSGKKICHQRGIRHLGDLMLRPLCSNEVPVLARTLIKISKNLNSQYALPKTAFTVRVSWVDIFDMSFTERTKLLPSFTVWHILSLKYIQGLCTVIKLVVGDLIGGCRFNLRFFGDYYFLLHLICCYMALMLLQHLWGVLFFFVYTFLFFAITVVYFVL